VRQVAAELDLPLAQVAIAWIFSRPQVTSVIAGGRSLEQFEQIAAGANLTLLPEVVAHLDHITDPLKHQMGASIDYYQSSDGGRSW
jgi:aryl-alcohol dehydrogenase-like predicted oxidoreductase